MLAALPDLGRGPSVSGAGLELKGSGPLEGFRVQPSLCKLAFVLGLLVSGLWPSSGWTLKLCLRPASWMLAGGFSSLKWSHIEAWKSGCGCLR